MKGKRKFSPEFKAKVALEAIKGQKTLNELSKEYELTPKQISDWKKEFLVKAALVFTKESPDLSKEKEIHELHARIGQLDMMVDFLKKSCDRAHLRRRAQADGGARSFGAQRVAAMHTSGLVTVKFLLQAGGRERV